MAFTSVEELASACAGAVAIEGDRIRVTGEAAPGLVDRLARTAVFGASPEIRGTARWTIRALAGARGIRPASLHELHVAMGRGQEGGVTVPAMTIRLPTHH